MDHNNLVTPQQLEVLVLAAIDRLRAGGQIEDDRIEVKREWPEVTKARQLAGAANRARGYPLVYIIGLDEKTGATHPNGSADVATWWAQVSAGFDQVPPEMVRHLNVTVGPGESVTALHFATDRAPYVVKNSGSGAAEREVPIRDGTRTRSATRDELLRMLAPEIALPPVVLLGAEGSASWYGAKGPEVLGVSGRPESTTFSGVADIFIEHLGPGGILLPKHEAAAELESDSIRLPLSVWWSSGAKDAPPPPAFGVDLRREGIAATGPGRARLRLGWTAEGDYRAQLREVQAWTLRLRLGVTGSSRPIRLECHMPRDSTMARRDSEDAENLGRWGYWESPPGAFD